MNQFIMSFISYNWYVGIHRVINTYQILFLVKPKEILYTAY
jgi:hypothetical protein